MMKAGLVLIAAPVHSVLIDGLLAAGYELTVKEDIVQEEGAYFVRECTGIITSTRLQLDRSLLDAAPGLQWIGRMGSGMEIIDVPYATDRGIRCYSSPEGNRNAVGEHAIGMLLSLTKRIVCSDIEIRHNEWKREANRGIELEGKTIAIIGFGHTGRSFAKKLSGFDMQILAYDKQDMREVPAYVTKCESLEQVYREADIVSFHVPLQADTYHYFNQEFAEKMHKSFILINTSRGQVVDTAVLYNSLKNGKVRGACLDVLEEEPLQRMSKNLKEIVVSMSQMDQVIITPHIAGYSHESLFKMSKVLLEKIVTNR